MFATLLVAMALGVYFFMWGANRSAAFVASDGVSIAIELRPAHPTLAEYERRVVLAKDRKIAATLDLTRDTGGYAAANLYRCSPDTYMLDSYGEFLFIDAKTGTAKNGKCMNLPTYLGVFDGGGSAPWRFIPASQAEERLLQMLSG